MEYSVNLTLFQGPFELLFHLIEKKEIDIYDIPIKEITGQYLDYLESMKKFNMNITSEFVLMAATLLEIKSQMLLPMKENKEDPRMELVNKLLEYKMFKDISEKLKEYENESSYYFSKPKEEIVSSDEEIVKIEQLSLKEIDIYELYNIFVKLIKNQNLEIEKDPDFKVFKETFTVKECMDELINKAKKNGRVSLFKMFREKGKVTKQYIITSFLAILEISKISEYKIYQNEIYSDIFIIFGRV